MSERCRRRKSKVNYRLLNDELSSDDDFTPSLKKSKVEKKPRLSRDDKRFEKDIQRALAASSKSKQIDTTLVIVNENIDEEDTSNEEDNHRDSDNSFVRSCESSTDGGGSELCGSGSDDEDCDEFELKKPLLKGTKKNSSSSVRSRRKKTTPKKMKENTAPNPLTVLDPPAENAAPEIPKALDPRDNHLIASIPLVSVKQSKKPYWNPPGKAGSSTKSSPSIPSSDYKPVPATPTIISPGSTIRVGLSRNVKVKPLHQNIKMT